MHAYIHTCIYVYVMYVCMYVCMYVYIYIYICMHHTDKLICGLLQEYRAILGIGV